MPGIPYKGRTYRFIDSDEHVTEPPDLWKKRVPQKLQDRAPQSTKDARGNDAWALDGGKTIRPLTANTNSLGLSTVEVTSERIITYDTIRPSHYDGKARLADMDVDGIHGAVIYSTFGLGGTAAFGSDREVVLACTRAYNDWLVEEFCSADPNRLFGVALAPVTGVDDLIAESEHAMKTGHKGVILTRWPNGGQGPQPDDEKFWKFAESNNIPICVHFGPAFGPTIVQGEPMGPNQIALGTNSKAGVTGIPVLDALLGQAIGERFPKIKIALVESNIGWLPSYLEQADDRWLHFRFYTGKHNLKMTPSEQFQRNFYATYMCDRIGVELRHHIGVDRIMWSTDLPHGGHEWPNTRNQFDRLYRDVPEDDIEMLVHGNAANFYGITETATPSNGAKNGARQRQRVPARA